MSNNLAHPSAHILSVPHAAVQVVALSPDASRLATGCADGYARIYALPSGQLVATTPHQEGSFISAKFSPEGYSLGLLTNRADAPVVFYNAATGAPLPPLPEQTSAARAFDFSPDGQFIAVGDAARAVTVYRRATWQKIKRLPLVTEDPYVDTVQFTSDGQRLWAATGTVLASWPWLELREQPAQTYPIQADVVGQVTLAPAGATVAYTTGTNLAYQPLAEMTAPKASPDKPPAITNVSALSFTPDGKLLAVASRDHVLHFLDTATGQEIFNTHLLRNEVTGLSFAFSAGHRYLATNGAGGQAQLWDLDALLYRQLYRRSAPDDISVVCGPSAARLINKEATQADLRLFFKSPATGNASPLVAVTYLANAYRGRAFTPDGNLWADGYETSDGVRDSTSLGLVTVRRRLPVCTGLNTLGQLLEVGETVDLARLQARPETLSKLVFAPDGTRLLRGSQAGDINIWRMDTFSEVFARRDHSGKAITCLAFASDGATFLTAGADGLGKLWNAATGQEIARFTPLTLVETAVFAPASQTFATGGQDGVISLWRTADGARLATLTGHKTAVSALAYTPDGLRLASASDLGEIRLWDTVRGVQMALIQTPEVSLSQLVFSPDGSRLMSQASQVDTAHAAEIRLYDATPHN